MRLPRAHSRTLARLACAAAAALLAAARPALAADRPNLLLIVADDLCWRDVGFTGNKDVITPNLDRLRSEGMLLRRMYSPAATCTPTRCALYTGLYNVRTGSYPNHSHVNAGTRSIFTYLKQAGYRVALQNKSDVRPPASFPYEYIDAEDDFAPTRKFVTRDAAQPWMLVFGSHDPHSPWTRGPKEKFDPAKLTVPPYMHDNAVTRKAMANYYAEITALDGQVGHLMDLVRETGHDPDTLVMFVSEQGSSLPFGGKWFVLDNGVHSAAVARWPGHIAANSSSDALMSYVDVVPTFLTVAGIDAAKVDAGCPDANGAKGLDGEDALDVLLGKRDALRDVAFAQHTALGVIGTVGPYPTRMATDGRYQYVRCLSPDKTFSIGPLHRHNVVESWQKDAANDPALAKRIDELFHQPAEALYDLQVDPYELHNVAGDPALAAAKERLSKRLDGWMAQQGDKGLATELAFKSHMTKGGDGD